MKVFISYRREDSAGHTGRLYDSLRGPIGDDNLFLDLSGIDSGQNFVEVIQTAIQSCDVLLAIIGPEWLTCAADGRRRLDDPTDLVQSEIHTALERNIPVIPVLVGGASPPAADALPPPLTALATRDAHELTDERWGYDVERLVTAMRRIATPRQGPRRRAWLLAASVLAIAVAALAVIASYSWTRIVNGPRDGADAGTVTNEGPPPAVPTPAEPKRPPPVRIAGSWNGEVTYDWGAKYTERFALTVDGTELSGTASFLGVPRLIIAGRVEGDRITFETRTQEIGSEPRNVVHRYRGRVAGTTIAFLMQSEGGSSDVPVSFTAVRTEPPSP